jgi:hypothetical protein
LRLPGGETVRIDDRKVRGYLLSKVHPVGRFKARVFASAGFTESAIDAFVAQVRLLAATGEVSGVEDTEYGRKYTVPGALTGPVKAVQVLTVWIEEPGQVSPRLVTVQPS